MKRSWSVLFLVSVCVIGFTQNTELEDVVTKQSTDTVDGWKLGGIFSVTGNQTTLTNWAAGGQSAVSGSVLLSTFANYWKAAFTLDNELTVGYGLLKSQGQKVRKSDDRIELTSKLGTQAFRNWYYAVMLDIRTQMTDGFNYPDDSSLISAALAPAYILGAVGLDWKPSRGLTVFVAPVTSKTTIVNTTELANAGAFGVDPAEYNALGNVATPGKKIRSEFGSYLRFGYVKPDIIKNVNLSTKLGLFSNHLNKPQNIDVNWEILIVMKVNKYLMVNLTTHLLYDHDIQITDADGKTGPRTQFKEVFGAGFSYKW